MSGSSKEVHVRNIGEGVYIHGSEFRLEERATIKLPVELAKVLIRDFPGKFEIIRVGDTAEHVKSFDQRPVGKLDVKSVPFKEVDGPVLSILICSLESREDSRNRLLESLRRQDLSKVEVLVEVDKGSTTIGAKRNLLLRRSAGKYICFVDDDDMVTADYVSKILEAVVTGPDCCGMEGMLISEDRGTAKRFIHTLQCTKWYEKDGVYYRCPNHLSPIKRELALSVGFPEKNVSEDFDYSMKLVGKIKTEVMISGTIYIYLS